MSNADFILTQQKYDKNHLYEESVEAYEQRRPKLVLEALNCYLPQFKVTNKHLVLSRKVIATLPKLEEVSGWIYCEYGARLIAPKLRMVNGWEGTPVITSPILLWATDGWLVCQKPLPQDLSTGARDLVSTLAESRNGGVDENKIDRYGSIWVKQEFIYFADYEQIIDYFDGGSDYELAIQEALAASDWKPTKAFLKVAEKRRSKSRITSLPKIKKPKSLVPGILKDMEAPSSGSSNFNSDGKSCDETDAAARIRQIAYDNKSNPNYDAVGQYNQEQANGQSPANQAVKARMEADRRKREGN